ncbi:Fanconi anemia group G protein [Ambystoma mexicanum]|uniref:Fanconi anemia group G protein n=1 Tax=Ambystoma mexicanum TaxID=8296 RepID=UPI0037E8D81C
MMSSQDSKSCAQRWAEENSDVISRWKAIHSSADGNLLRETVQECQLVLSKLLQKIQGLPAAVLSLPLEIAVLCNSIVFSINVTGGFTDKDAKTIHHGLLRVLETKCPSGQEFNCMELWQKILEDVTSEELSPSLHQLAGLQAAMWLASNQTKDVERLFQLLESTEQPMAVDFCSRDNDLLRLVRAWHVPEEQMSAYPMAESTRNLKDMLCTTVAFQQGLQRMDAGDPLGAVENLQEAAAGLCSTKVLAKLFTCIGCCYQRMDRPQAALQWWKQAIQADFRCLSALFHVSALYHQLGKTDAELEALRLLDEALNNPEQRASSISHDFLVKTEFLVLSPSLATISCSPNQLEVKYLIARRYLQVARFEEAVEHYLDLLAALHEGSDQQVFSNSLTAFPRIPEVYLEAASALLMQKRFHDAVTLCDEVVDKTKELIPENLNIELRSDGQSPEDTQREPLTSIGGAQIDLVTSRPEEFPGLSEQNKESLRCILWASTALFFQGQALAQLQDCKDSITQFSRCINLLLKIQLLRTGTDPTVAAEHPPRDVKVLNALKTLALLGRGVQFLKLGKEKDALMNLQLCLQLSPDHREATFYLLNVLWKLNRKQEAASYWQRVQSNLPTTNGKQENACRHMPLYLVPHLRENIPQEEVVIRKIQDFLHSNTKDC